MPGCAPLVNALLARYPDITVSGDLRVQSAALGGVFDVQKIVNGRTDADSRRLDYEIELFLRDPRQNMPKLKPSGVPSGPPV